MKKRQVPAALVNARLSQRSYLGYKRISFFMSPLLSTFSTICTQTEEDARRFKRLGLPANRIASTGNLKFDQEYDSISEGELEALRQSMQIKPWQRVLLAGSTHKGEEEILLDVLSRLKGEFPDLLLIIAPRQPKRALSVCRMFRSAGFAGHLLKDLPSVQPDAKTDLIVVDVIGMLRRLYALADVAFVGGSLVNSGGQNPLEPAIFSKPVLFGPHMDNFKEISHMLLASGGAVQVSNAEGLYNAAAALLDDRSKSGGMGEHAFNLVSSNKGVVERTVGEIEKSFKIDLLSHTGNSS
jgi:3-deoxy-D-manno-octulosonic-acid transferase